MEGIAKVEAIRGLAKRIYHYTIIIIHGNMEGIAKVEAIRGLAINVKVSC